jgi:hypothetical protein
MITNRLLYIRTYIMYMVTYVHNIRVMCTYLFGNNCAYESTYVLCTYFTRPNRLKHKHLSSRYKKL